MASPPEADVTGQRILLVSKVALQFALLALASQLVHAEVRLQPQDIRQVHNNTIVAVVLRAGSY